jgi:hypothetical protein
MVILNKLVSLEVLVSQLSRFATVQTLVKESFRCTYGKCYKGSPPLLLTYARDMLPLPSHEYL